MTNPETSTETPLSTKDKVLETAASATQSFPPISSICAHLNAFHVYASDPTRCVESNHYCTHVTPSLRQCLIYDSHSPSARLIGIEYMITPSLYATLPPTEQKLWHSHVFEVKSGMLTMPGPKGVPNAVWEKAEDKEMEEVVGLYGKTYHFWEVDKGHEVPMGEPKLMGSITGEGQVPGFGELLAERDSRFGVDSKEKGERRGYIKEPEVHTNADGWWKDPRPETTVSGKEKEKTLYDGFKESQSSSNT